MVFSKVNKFLAKSNRNGTEWNCERWPTRGRQNSRPKICIQQNANGQTCNMGWNSHNHNIVYMFTIYTLLLIELRIIGSRIWTAYSFIFGIRFNRGQRQRESEKYLYIWSFIAKNTVWYLYDLACGWCCAMCMVSVVQTMAMRSKKRRKYETIDKCWFAALISRSAWVWHGFVRPFVRSSSFSFPPCIYGYIYLYVHFFGAFQITTEYHIRFILNDDREVE